MSSLCITSGNECASQFSIFSHQIQGHILFWGKINESLTERDFSVRWPSKFWPVMNFELVFIEIPVRCASQNGNRFKSFHLHPVKEILTCWRLTLFLHHCLLVTHFHCLAFFPWQGVTNLSCTRGSFHLFCHPKAPLDTCKLYISLLHHVLKCWYCTPFIKSCPRVFCRLTLKLRKCKVVLKEGL